MRLGRTTAIYVITKFVGNIVAFIALIYFTRTLGEEIYGFYAITLALVSWLGLIKTIGFGKAIIKRMSEGEEPNKYFVAGAMIQGGFTAIIAIGVFIFREQVNAYVGQPVAQFVVLLLVISVLGGLANSGLQGTHRVHVNASLDLVKKVARNLIMIVLVFLGWELSGMLFGHALGAVLISVVGIWIVNPTLTIPRWRHISRLFDFAKYSWLGNMSRKSYKEADIIVLGIFVSPGLVGIYTVAYKLSNLLGIFGYAIQNTMFPELSERSSEDDVEMIRTLTTEALTYAGLFLIPGIAGAAILGDRLMLLFGDGFEIGTQVLTILLIGVLIYTYNNQLLNTLNGIDRPDLAFRVNGIFIIANIVLNVFLVYNIGWVGAALATTISSCIGLVFGLHYAHQLVEFHLPFGEISKQCLAAALMGVFVYVARSVGETSPIAEYNEVFVVLLVGSGAAIYFLVLVSFSTSFRTTVMNNLPFDLWMERN